MLALIDIEKYVQQHQGNKAIISASPNEYHEIGARMVADVLRVNGWNTRYLGSNTPTDSIIELMESFKPDILALSVTIPFNIEKARDIIDKVRKNKKLERTKIMVGGLAFKSSPDLWKKTGADGYAGNVGEVIQTAMDLMAVSVFLCK